MKNKLNILWTNDNVETSKLMVLMYARNAMLNNWYDEVTVIIWGATAKLVATNKEIQEIVKQTAEAGVFFSACLVCSDELNATQNLNKLGVETIYWGVPLTNIIKNNEHLLTI